VDGDTIRLIAQLVVPAATILGVAYRLGGRLGGIQAELKTLNAWMHDLAAGKSPVCAQHREAIHQLDRRMARLESLELEGGRYEADEDEGEGE
jgi:hypothetical protein